MALTITLLLSLSFFIVGVCAGPDPHPLERHPQTGNPPNAGEIRRVFFIGGLVLLGLATWIAI